MGSTIEEEEEVFNPSRRSSGGVGGEMDLGRIFGVLSFQRDEGLHLSACQMVRGMICSVKHTLLVGGRVKEIFLSR